MEKETSKVLLQKTIGLRKADGIPVVTNTCVFNMKHFGKKYISCLVDPREYVEIELMCYKKFGYDGVWTISPMEAVGEALGSKLRFFEDDVPAIAEPILKEPQDLKKLIREDRDITLHHRIRFLCEVVSDLKRAIGNETMVMANAHSVFRLAGMLRGINNLYMYLVLNPNFVKDLQDFCLPKCVDFALELAEAGADMIVVTNPIANASCISRKMYASQVHPYTKKLYQAIKETPAKLAFHPCGQWDDRFDLLIEEAPDVLWVDKVDLAWLKDKYGEKVCIMGNVKTTETMLQGTSKQVEDEALECIRKGSRNGGFILSADCALPRDVPAENLQALIDTARRYTG